MTDLPAIGTDLEPGVGRTRLYRLPVIPDTRGNLTFIETPTHLPFPIQRVYYLYDVPTNAHRGGHAHKALHQLLIAISGSFEVVTDNGTEQRAYPLNNAAVGLYIGPFVWRELQNFSSNAVCLVLASLPYDEADYFRDFEAFKDSLPS